MNIFLAAAILAVAGDLPVSVHYGPTRAKWYGSDVKELGYDEVFFLEGRHVRISQPISLSDRIRVRLETGWIVRGFRSRPGNPVQQGPDHFHMGEDYGYRMEYWELMSLGEFAQSLPGRGEAYGLAGPTAGFQQTCDHFPKDRGRSTGNCGNFKLFDPGITLGVGIRYRVPYYDFTLSSEVLWSRGFRSMPFVEHAVDNDIHNGVLILQVGFSKKPHGS